MIENWRTLREIWANYPSVLRLVWGASPRFAFFATFFAMLSAVAAPAQIWLSKIIIDSIIGTIQRRVPDAAVDWTALFVPVGALVLVLVLGEVGRRLAESMVQMLRFQVQHYVDYLLLKKAAQFDIAFYESSIFYDKLDFARRESYRTFNLAFLATDSVGLLLSLLITLSLVTQFHPLASVVMLLISAPQLIVNSQYAQEMFALLNRQTPARRMVDYLSQLLTEREAIKEIRLFGLQQPFLDRFQDFWQTFFAETTRIIFQDFVRYHLTVQENIGFGQVNAVDDLARVTRAAEKGGAAPLIDKLPAAYQTRLGKTFDNSVDLSGGEWQKIALGRAFMRDAPILILDEPTAALDAKAEYDVYLRFAELTANKITVFVSHRFSTVRMAQHILVLANGRLIEEGAHDRLMALNGQYAEMFNVQAERYR